MLQKTPLLLFAFGAFSQTPNFDGIVDEDEWQNAQRFSISHEIEPADNGPALLGLSVSGGSRWEHK